MKRGMVFLCFLGIAAVGSLSGCSFVPPQIRSENEAEIELSLEKTEEKATQENADFSEGDLYTMFEEVSNEPVINFLYDDYNKDGIHEAFVLTRGEDACKLWHMSSEGCKIVKENLTEVAAADTDILVFHTKDYLILQQEEDECKKTFVYSIGNANQVIEPGISGKGYLHQNEEGELLLRVMTEAAGRKERAFCDYYLYYTLDEGFKEYGAIPIVEEQFLEFGGAQEILDDIYETYLDYEVECSFLYRSNHYINVNIVLRKDGRQQNKHITLKYDTHEVKYISEDLQDGRIEIAYMLEIGTFPTAFRHPSKKIEE